MQRKAKKTGGFTLVELMVALGLLSLVVIGGFRLYYFTDRSFVRGAITADIQADIHLAMQRIANELRVAHNPRFITKDEIPEVIELVEGGGPEDNKKDAHYLFVEEGSVILRTKNGSEMLTPFHPDSQGYALSFSYDEHLLPNVLGVKLTSLNSQVAYSIESSIQLLNLRTDVVGGDAGTGVLYFAKSLSEREIKEAEEMKRRCLVSSFVFAPNEPELLVLRRFRDERLLTNRVGRFFVDFYYSLSPAVISLFKMQPLARLAAQAIIRRIVGVVVFFS